MTGIPSGTAPAEFNPLAAVLDRVRQHLGSYIRVADDRDLDALTLWIAHTWVCEVTYTSPRLILDSTMPGSGKTTVLEHIQHLAYKPVQATGVSSAATLGRLFANGPVTLLLDEVDRLLDPKLDTTGGFTAIINGGYKVGSTRLVTEMTGNKGEVVELPTYGPVALAGNSPQLADDTRSRSIRLLLMPDFEGTVLATEWEDLDAPIYALGVALGEALEHARAAIASASPVLPPGCIMRFREKWKPLARVAEVAGGEWPARCAALAVRDLEEAEAEREAGLTKLPPVVLLIKDLHGIWPESRDFLATKSEIVPWLIEVYPEHWGELSEHGKALTVQRLGRLLTGIKVGSTKNSSDQRGYYRSQFVAAWRAHGFLAQAAPPPDPFADEEPF